ncbi:MAG: TlpA family protein disulfide reductase [Candidatus Heimdallarchaeota archaeon]|nr:TlpA family protein disulfide reductase [Candidatus Heimdallarchaeota archaeon]
MKKYFPAIIFFLSFSGFLGIQVLGDILSAKPSSIEKSRANHYESIFQKLELDVIDEGKLKLSELKSPIVILNFWASWCQPCLMEFPSLYKLSEKFNQNDITIIGINGDEQKQLSQIQKITKKYNLSYPQYADKDGDVLNQFRVSALPMTIIYHEGKVIEVSTGVKNFYAKDLVEKFESLILKSKKKITLAR